MKYIPNVTILLWLFLIFGCINFPEYFLKEYVQYPLVVLISILIPVSFWLKNKEKNRFFAIIFIGLFLVNVAFLTFAIEQNFSTQQTLQVHSRKGIIPEIAELLSESENTEKSKFAAKVIYRENAVLMPYKSSDNNFTLYSPSQSDRKSYQKNVAERAHWDVAKMNAKGQMLSTFFLLMVHVGIFLLVIIFLIMTDE